MTVGGNASRTFRLMSRRLENTILWTLLGISIVSVILIKTTLADIPENWKYGHEIGEIVYDLSLAYIASWIFYIVVVVIPKHRNDRNINFHARILVDGIFYTGHGILHGLSSGVKDFEKEMTEEEFLKLCTKIGPESMQDYFSTPSKQYPINYLDHIIQVKDRVNSDAQKLFVYMSHLDPELIRLVNDIIYCQLMTHLNAYFADKQYRQPTFESISSALYDFYKKVGLLRTYRLRNLS